MKTDKKIEEIIKNIINFYATSYLLDFPISSFEHKAYLRRTLLEYRNEVKKETLNNAVGFDLESHKISNEADIIIKAEVINKLYENRQ